MGDGLPIVATLGEPAGVGPEILGLAWLDRGAARTGPFCCIGDPSFLRSRFRSVGLDVPVRAVDGWTEVCGTFDEALPVMGLQSRVVSGTAGRPSPEDAASVLESIERAVSAVGGGLARAMVTAPIQKETLYQAGFAYPGHTEYLGALTRDWPGGGGSPVMMLASDELRVAPVTIHVPLARVPHLLSEAAIMATCQTVATALRTQFAIPEPRLAVSGLNPHAGEAGRLGEEEQDIIAPAIARLRAEGLQVAGPLPADTMFHPRARAGYDAAVTMYHDQALVPIKTLAFDRAVNVTLGLPLVRTSPDHGTALDIAGTGTASPSSFIAAMRLARTLTPPR